MNLTHTHKERLFFTADHHFGHHNIINFTKRPFNSVEEMNQKLIDNWNNKVPSDGIVIHLGDFTLDQDIIPYIEQLNGNIWILDIPWHHDRLWLNIARNVTPRKTKTGKMELLGSMDVLSFYNRKSYPETIALSHYPLAIWDKKHYGSWHLHGHSHGKYHAEGKVMDVGVDNSFNYSPFSYDEIKQYISKL